MALVETLGWIAFQATILFLVLLGLSRLLGTRGGPGLFKVLWLCFFFKLLVPIGLFHPEPVPIPMELGAFPSIQDRNTQPGQNSAQAEPLPELFWDPGKTLAIVWGLGALTVWTLMTVGYRKVMRSPLIGPVTVGFFHPRILLPKDFSEKFTLAEQKLILCHENNHLKALDPLQLAFCNFVTGLYWWLPPVWWARHEFAAAMESACDATVLNDLDLDQIRLYGELLVRMASSPRSEYSQNLAWFGGSFGALRRRVIALLSPRWIRGPLAGMLTSVLAVGISGLALTPPEIHWAWPLPLSLEAVAPVNQTSWLILETRVAAPVTTVAQGIARKVPIPGLSSLLVIDHGDGYISEYEGVTVDPWVIPGATIGPKVQVGLSDPRCFTVRLLHFGIPMDLGKIYPSQLAKTNVSGWGLQEAHWPLPSGVGQESAEFGLAAHPFTGQEYFHTGTDWVAPPGTPVKVLAGGTVEATGHDIPSGTSYILVAHGNGRTSRYSQLTRLRVTQGQQVEAGELLGEIAPNPSATGPHLHWEVTLNGYYLDPMEIIYQ